MTDRDSLDDRDRLEAAMPAPDERMRRALDAATGLLDTDGVEGVGEGETTDGEPCIRVMIRARTPELERRIPTHIEGVPVKVVESGPFTAGG